MNLLNLDSLFKRWRRWRGFSRFNKFMIICFRGGIVDPMDLYIPGNLNFNLKNTFLLLLLRNKKLP